MRLLLDTHALLWWLEGDRRLSRRARTAIGDEGNLIMVSAASASEITTKARLGKLPGALEVAADVAGCVTGQGFLALDITILHAQRAGRMPGAHRDPFDRMLIAQARAESLTLATRDETMRKYPVRVLSV